MSDREAGAPYRAARSWLVAIRAPIAPVVLSVGWFASLVAESRKIEAFCPANLNAIGVFVVSESHRIDRFRRPLAGRGLALPAIHRGRGEAGGCS